MGSEVVEDLDAVSSVAAFGDPDSGAVSSLDVGWGVVELGDVSSDAAGSSGGDSDGAGFPDGAVGAAFTKVAQ